jgi:ATP-binding cassette subfamily C protein CydCD
VREPARPAAPPATAFPLELRGIGARYADRRRDALSGFDLTLTPGKRVAVVGVSGSGKTTLAQVLLRFLDAGSGTYTLGGVPAGEMEGDTVRRFVGLCAQDAHLFDSSVRENLRLARPDATEEELRGALDEARLLEWVDALPYGLDTLVGEHGARLSGGQRQRLALARALLAAFPVLVLDEPAEHLDLATADALTADLLAATERKATRPGGSAGATAVPAEDGTAAAAAATRPATVLITHRLRGLETVDEIVVLESGRVVQRGTYEDLAVIEGPLRTMLEREQAADRIGARLSLSNRTN